mmetsp:Transcript_21627/g.43032  ORF Transcript_21627/g.43032 Transcript_21627/m.43032 type:complete len:106 (+) Transcript_21627:161-478(+)
MPFLCVILSVGRKGGDTAGVGKGGSGEWCKFMGSSAVGATGERESAGRAKAVAGGSAGAACVCPSSGAKVSEVSPASAIPPSGCMLEERGKMEWAFVSGVSGKRL